MVSSSVSKETHYIRDGSGNVLAIYENKILDELVIYGSSRLGSYNGKTLEGKRTLGNKKYELSNHLGNVLSVISDNKIGVDNVGSDLIADIYEPLVISESDYYPFGMAMKERSFSNEEYRFGFNTQEKSTELGEDTYTAEFWQYDSKIARRWNNDPRPNTSISVYAAFAGNPIWFNDVKGDTVRGTQTEMQEYNNFRANINTTITQIHAQINTLNNQIQSTTRQGRINRLNRIINDLNTELNVLETTNTELDQLESSTQDYVLNIYNNQNDTKGGGVIWKASITKGVVKYTDAIQVSINTAHGNIDGKFAHELKHAFQYENHQLTFGYSGNPSLNFYNLAEEIEAYQRQFYFETLNNSDGTSVSNINEITGQWVINRSFSAYGHLQNTTTT